MKPIRIWCELYKETFVFYPGLPEELFEKKTGVGVAGSDGMTTQQKDSIHLWVRDTGIAGIPDLAHECIHSANYCFERRGVEHTVKNDEAQAYLVEWLMRKCMKHMRVK